METCHVFVKAAEEGDGTCILGRKENKIEKKRTVKQFQKTASYFC